MTSRAVSRRVGACGLAMRAPVLVLYAILTAITACAPGSLVGRDVRPDAVTLAPRPESSPSELAGRGGRERRVALVVGNSAYPSTPLRNPLNDARAIAEALRRYGFEVRLTENARQRDLRRAIVEFGLDLREADVGLFYFAGHGLQVNGRNFVVPIDATINSEVEVEVEAVDVGAVLARMETARSRLNIVILDACRDNPYTRGFRSVARGLASTEAPTGTVIGYATAPGRVALDGAGANGLYTEELLRAMAVPDLKIEEVFKRVRKSVTDRTRGSQVPWEASSLINDFVFLHGAASRAASPPAPSAPPRPARSPDPPREVAAVSRRAPGTDAAEMILVPAGAFSMGRDRDELVEDCRHTGIGDTQCRGHSKDEGPRRRVTLQAFHIDRFEVTNADFERFVEASGYRTTLERDSPDAAQSWRTAAHSSGRAKHPVVFVSWHDAHAYCAWAGKRLPTEAEWEKAARGSDGRRFPWGDEWDSTRANGERTLKTTSAVGSYPRGASPYGVEDMAGNVWEWVADWYDESYYRRGPEVDPPGPTEGTARVIRGGSWRGDSFFLRSSYRVGGTPDSRADYIGFRCARSQ